MNEYEDNETIINLAASMKALDLSTERILEICNSNDTELKSHILFYKDLPEDATDILKNDKCLSVKRSYAWTYATTEELDALILDKDKGVRWRAAANPNITEEQLFTLINQENFVVNRNIASNVMTPLSILEELVKNKNETISSLAKDNFKEKYYLDQCLKGEMSSNDKEIWNKAIETYGLNCVVAALDGSWKIKDICNGYVITTINVLDMLNIPDNMNVDVNPFNIDIIDYIDEMREFGVYREKSPNTLAIENGESVFVELKDLLEHYDLHITDAWMPIVSDRNTAALEYLKEVVNEEQNTELEEQTRSR